MPPKSNANKADSDLLLVNGVIHQLLPNGTSNRDIDFAKLATYLRSGKPDSARMRWNRFIQHVDWDTGNMLATTAAATGAGGEGGESSKTKEKNVKKGGKVGVKRAHEDEALETDGNLEEVEDLAVQTPQKKRKTKGTEN